MISAIAAPSFMGVSPFFVVAVLLCGDWNRNCGTGKARRAPDAAQRAALAERCAAEPGSRLLATRRNRAPGSAKHRSARATRCIAPGTRVAIVIPLALPVNSAPGGGMPVET